MNDFRGFSRILNKA